MKIDLAVVVVILFFGGLGLWSGAIRQLAHLGGLIAGYLSARPLGLIAGPIVAQKLGYPLLFTSIGCSFVLFFVVYALTVLVLRLVLSKLLPDGESGALNRMGGFALGAAKAAVIVFVTLSALVLVEKPLSRLLKPYAREAKSSIAVGLARRHSLFAQIPQLASIEKLVKASADPKAAARIAEDPQLKALAMDPRMKSLVNDAAVRRALENGDYAALLSSVNVLKVLNDPKLSERLAKAASESLNKAAAETQAQAPPKVKPREKRPN
ncbi:MAG: CvpA family protein [Myxococcales bacterium]